MSVNCQPGDGFDVQMACVPAEEMNVLDHIAAFVNAGQRGPEMKIHVGEKTVLGIMCPNRDRSGVALFNLDVNVGERRIKGAGIGIGHRAIISWTPSGEKKHELFMRGISEAGRVGGQNNHRPGGAIANQSDAGPDIKGVTDVILARREQNNALARSFPGPG